MRPSQNLSHFGTSSKDQLGGFCVKRDLDPEAMSKKDKMEKWIEMDWNSRIFIHLHVSESASKFLAKELGNRCLSSQALHQTHPLRSWCRIELWVRTPSENACHGAIFTFLTNAHTCFSPQDGLFRWTKFQNDAKRISLFQFYYSVAAVCSQSDFAMFCKRQSFPSFVWPFLYPCASNCPQVSDPFTQLQNRTSTVCTRRTRISWIQSHYLATKVSQL